MSALAAAEAAADGEGHGASSSPPGGGDGAGAGKKEEERDGRLMRRAEAGGVVPEMRRTLKMLAEINQVKACVILPSRLFIYSITNLI